MTAVGDSIEEAKMALDRLLAIARAIEVTRHHTFSADHSHLKPSGGRDMRVVGRSEHEHR
jgi:hypothetical protein